MMYATRELWRDVYAEAELLYLSRLHQDDEDAAWFVWGLVGECYV